MQGEWFSGATECVEFLSKVTNDSVNPQYIVKEVEQESLDLLRKKETYVKYESISGSSKFRILIFESNSSICKAAPYVYVMIVKLN